MAWPVGPLNNAITTINGTAYIYNSTTNAWSISTPTYSSVSNILTVGNSIVTGNLTANTVVNSPAMANGNSNVTIAANSTVAIAANGAVRVTVDANGNVGVGTSSPATRLDVQSSSAGTATGLLKLYATNGSDRYAGIDFHAVTSESYNKIAQITAQVTNGGTGSGAAIGGDLIFRTNGSATNVPTERMRITSAGELLLNTTTTLVSGAGSVSFVGSTTNRCWVNVGRATAATTGTASSITGWNGATQVCSIDFNANGANNSGLIQTYTWSAGSPVQGPYVTTGGTSWTTASDENLKDIIEPIENGVEKLSSLRSVIGKFKTDHDDVRRVFLIAQDVQAVLPEAVVTDGDGHLGLNYQDMIPILVKAIQELSAEVEVLKAKVGA